MRSSRTVAPAWAIALAATLAAPALAQDLEPRAFSPAPVGMNFALVGYGYSDGNVFFDQSLPVKDATGTLHSATGAYVRTLDLCGATAKLAAIVPFVWGDWRGLYLDQPAATSRRGFADPVVNLAVNFVGAPARRLQELATYREGTIVGAALLASIPVGQYDPDRLINLGSNRWSFRGRLGASQRVGRWNFEAMGELWFFTRNPEAYGGVTISQDPILAIQVNAIHRFRRGFWVAVGGGYGEGGRTTVSGVRKDTRQINKRLGVTLVYPVGARHSLKLAYLRSLSTRVGADFDRLGVFWQLRWGGGL